MQTYVVIFFLIGKFVAKLLKSRYVYVIKGETSAVDAERNDISRKNTRNRI